ncbi:MAG: response regulator transcription factor [Bacteroidales bacterium]|jgi:DNA-binding response OmpR family regulator|nr:response regulator transcription factor [Bacteroidales bacterium]
MRVLIVEDEKDLAQEINEFLTNEHYNCDVAHTGEDASESLAVNMYDFVLLDIGLPDYNGLDLLKEAKEYNSEAYFIIITARGEIEDKVKGLDLGADDYLAKPFALLELGSRIKAIARRKFGNKTHLLQFGNFAVDINKRILFFDDKPIDLTKKEYELISYFVLNKNRVLNRLQLTEHIWGDFYENDFDSNYIDVHIKNIRKKLATYDDTKWIKTVRGIGYKFEL